MSEELSSVNFSTKHLEFLYQKYNRREFVHPDPLEFLYQFDRIEDREIVGLIASSFAYGNVKQILASVRFILDKMGASPRSFVEDASPKVLERIFKGFKHRWHTEKDLAKLIYGLKKCLEQYGSMERLFVQGLRGEDDDISKALNYFVCEIKMRAPGMKKNLLPLPQSGSACKRLHMYLRWMVRQDAVDPGGWEGIPTSKLLVPLDTHMYRMCRRLKLTRRNQANSKTVDEVTKGFRKICPEDPVRYDFVLTRFGIRGDLSFDMHEVGGLVADGLGPRLVG